MTHAEGAGETLTTLLYHCLIDGEAYVRMRTLVCQPIRILTHACFQFDELAEQNLSPLVDVRWNLEATSINLLISRNDILELPLQIRQFRDQEGRQVIDIASSYIGGIIIVRFEVWNLQCQRLNPRVLQDGMNPRITFVEKEVDVHRSLAMFERWDIGHLCSI